MPLKVLDLNMVLRSLYIFLVASEVEAATGPVFIAPFKDFGVIRSLLEGGLMGVMRR